LPAKDIDFSLYLVSLIQSNKSSSTVDETFYSVKWAHELAGFVVKSVMEAAHRILGHSVSKKEPITSDILNQMVSRYIGHNSNTMNSRNVAMCLIAYAGFLRFSELSNIKRSDLVFHEDFLSIFIETSKTDIYREGESCLIAKTG
jgi:site-specific recombinase XerD